jgi:sortase A
VIVKTRSGDAVYQVRDLIVVNPNDTYVMNPSSTPTLTLITCFPFAYIGRAPKRYVVQADLVSQAGAALPVESVSRH